MADDMIRLPNPKFVQHIDRIEITQSHLKPNELLSHIEMCMKHEMHRTFCQYCMHHSSNRLKDPMPDPSQASNYWGKPPCEGPKFHSIEHADYGHRQVMGIRCETEFAQVPDLLPTPIKIKFIKMLLANKPQGETDAETQLPPI